MGLRGEGWKPEGKKSGVLRERQRNPKKQGLKGDFGGAGSGDLKWETSSVQKQGSEREAMRV